MSSSPSIVIPTETTGEVGVHEDPNYYSPPLPSLRAKSEAISPSTPVEDPDPKYDEFYSEPGSSSSTLPSMHISLPQHRRPVSLSQSSSPSSTESIASLRLSPCLSCADDVNYDGDEYVDLPDLVIPVSFPPLPSSSIPRPRNPFIPIPAAPAPTRITSPSVKSNKSSFNVCAWNACDDLETGCQCSRDAALSSGQQRSLSLPPPAAVSYLDRDDDHDPDVGGGASSVQRTLRRKPSRFNLRDDYLNDASCSGRLI